MAVLGLCCCCVGFFSGTALGVVHGLLIAVASLVRSTGCRSVGSFSAAPRLQSSGSIVVHRLNRSAACGIFLDQILNLCLLNWQADSFPLGHQGSPVLERLMKYFLISLPRKPGSFIVFFFLCLLHYFLPEGLMSLLREMGKGYLALCSYNCKEAINILSHLPSHHYNTGWVLCQIGRAYFELSEYMQVSI